MSSGKFRPSRLGLNVLIKAVLFLDCRVYGNFKFHTSGPSSPCFVGHLIQQKYKIFFDYIYYINVKPVI